MPQTEQPTKLSPWRGELQQDVALKQYTSWWVGGNAKQLYKPADLADLQCFLATLAADEPILWLGLGSNTLIRDGGFAGTVIATQGLLSELEIREDKIVRAEAGVTCPKLARFCVNHDLIDLEFLAGVPGTVGGALCMNAGCYGGETWNHVVAVEMLDRHGNIHKRSADEFDVSYRSVKFPAEEWFVAGYFQLSSGDAEAAKQKLKTLLRQRNESQPIGLHSCGSVFRNPPNDHAARLIEQAGLKGFQHGGAMVSDKHANFIINPGEATAADIEALIALIQATVYEKFQVKLQTEVHIIGIPGAIKS